MSNFIWLLRSALQAALLGKSLFKTFIFKNPNVNKSLCSAA